MDAAEKTYPEILADLATHVADLLVKNGVETEKAAALGYDAAEFIREHWGGQKIYLPKGLQFDLSQRDLEIYHKHNGRNTQQLAREYGLTEVRIYQIIKTVRGAEVRRRQPDLFTSEP